MQTITKKLEIVYRGQKIEIEYFIRRGSKEIIFYLHGLGCSKSDFFNATKIKSLKSYSLIAFDFPGHGNSSYSEKLGVDDLIEITNLFTKKLKLNNIVLIGHSLGGLVALLFTEKYSKKVKTFINIEGNLKSEDCFFSRQIIKVDFETFQKQTLQNFEFKLKKSDNIGFKNYAKILKKFHPFKAMYDYSPSMVQYSDSGKLIKIFVSLKIPKLFVYGEKNSSISYIKELEQNRCEIAKISRSNHFPQHDNPIELYKVISNFLLRNKKTKLNSFKSNPTKRD